MSHHPQRNQRIHILSLDPVLMIDVYERLHGHPGLEQVEIVVPGPDMKRISMEDVDRAAPDTRDSRTVIIDVQMNTVARLQGVYNKIVRYNRADLNLFCHIVLIGHGPIGLLDSPNGLDAFRPYVADMRNDYNPAVFFCEPFLHYTLEDMREVQQHDLLMPPKIPNHLEEAFKGNPTVEQVRRYLRATDIQDGMRKIKKQHRLGKMEKVFCKKIEEQFPSSKDDLRKGLSREGCGLPGEALRLNIYPFFFEERVLGLMSSGTL